MTKQEGVPSFWSTLPGILTGAAGLITAITGLLVLFVGGDSPKQPAGSNSPTTSASPSTPTSSTTITIPIPPDETTRSSTAQPESQMGCFGIDALITLSTERAPKGAPVVVSGSGYCPHDLIDIRVHLSDAGSVTTNGRGGFVKTISVPATAPSSGFPAGITAGSRAQRGSASAPFTIG